MPTAPEHPHTPLPELLEVFEVAHKLKRSDEYVRRLIRDRQIAAYDLGGRWCIAARDLAAFLEARRVDAVSEKPTAVIYQHPRGVLDAG